MSEFCDRKEISFESSSCDASQLNHRVRVFFFLSIIGKKKKKERERERRAGGGGNRIQQIHEAKFFSDAGIFVMGKTVKDIIQESPIYIH